MQNNFFISRGIGLLASTAILFAQSDGCVQKKQPIEPKLIVQHAEVDGQISELKIVLQGECFNNGNCIVITNAKDLDKFVESTQKAATLMQSIREKMIVAEQSNVDPSLSNVIPKPKPID